MEGCSCALTKIANVEKKLPASFISKDGFGLQKSQSIFSALLKGKDEDQTITMQAGKMQMVQKKLKPWA